MANEPNEAVRLLALRILDLGPEDLPAHERNVLERVAKRVAVSRNINAEYETGRTVGDKLADRVAAFGGSWTFLTIFAIFLAAWAILNSLILASGAFDPYPYILLNLFLSMLAAVQAPIILMSQNRQAAKDRLQAAHDYEVNLKAEIEILSLHDKLDEMRNKELAELVKASVSPQRNSRKGPRRRS